MLLVGVAGLAGMIDAIAGGGGLLALPAILWGCRRFRRWRPNCRAPLAPFTASYNFIRRGEIDLRRLRNRS